MITENLVVRWLLRRFFSRGGRTPKQAARCPSAAPARA